jgi:hypothetical protein
MSNANNQLYSDSYYDAQVSGSVRRARAVLEILFSVYRPGSVIDVGCGRGSWLFAATEMGVSRVIGVDGPWTNRDELLTRAIDFRAVDIAAGGVINESADLCMSMEVAEHLPAEHAVSFVKTLCQASDIVLFSAAIPNQGGTNHINERSQSYWAGLFAAEGFEPFDIFRSRLWARTDVEVWYRQNTFLYVSSKVTGIDRNLLTSMVSAIPDCIHPELFEGRMAAMRAIAESKKARIESPTLRFLAGCSLRWFRGLLFGPTRQR